MNKAILFCALLLWSVNSSIAQNIVQAEYWFDNDYANRVTQSLTSGSMVHFNSSIPTVGLDASLHTVHFRFKDNIGKWSAPVAAYFFKSNKIMAYRYWFNSDFANVQTVTLSPHQNIVQLNTTILTNTTTPSGPGAVHFQFQNTLGVWSSVVSDSIWNANQTCITWTDFSSDTLTFNAANYLCSLNIIQSAQSDSLNKKPILRQDLAKIVYLGLLGSNTATPADSFTSMFYDLQDPNVSYYKWAKALSYLEYGDGISPFSRVFTYFRPGEQILRKDAAKVFAEAWNLPITAAGPSPFNDVSTSDPMYPWIKTLYDSGIVMGNGTSFFPDIPLTRNDAFIILYRMLRQLVKPIPQNSDYYRPFNLTPKNSNRILGIDEGNFSAYKKTSFKIDGLIPLRFEHSYNSAATDIHQEYYERSTLLHGTVYNQQVLGPGWSHNFNTYIVPIADDTAGPSANDRLLLHWGNGEIVLYKMPASGIYVSEAIGSYDELISSGGQYILTTKGQTKYYFEPQFIGNSSNAFIATLVKIKDRNDNELNLTWHMYTAGTNNAPRLDTVTDPSGRMLTFSYNNGSDPYLITSVTAITGSISRNVSFTYNSTGQLADYTDPKGNSTSYIYDNNPVNHDLLAQIILPKGNVITNTYQNRKLNSSNVDNTVQVGVNSVNSYNDGTATTQATTTLNRNGQILNYSTQKNSNGNLTAFSGNGIDILTTYTDPDNPTLPTGMYNLITNLSDEIVYDSKGNVLSETRSNGSQTITKSFTYNAQNDVLSHTDARNNTTVFGYLNGNLISIQQPIGTTSISYNSNGTVASVTNPSNITTTYGYNIYGNQISSTIAGLITSSADFDDASRLIETTDPRNVSTTFSYDNNDNRLSDHLDPNGLAINTDYSFDINDNLSSITNALNGVTSLSYNNADLLVQQSFGGFHKQFEYNDDGTLKKFTSQNNVDFNYSYDATGQLVNDGYAAYTYNPDRTLHTLSANGKTLTYGYDDFKRVNSVSYSDFTGNTVTYQYDNNNNVTRINYPNNAFVAKYEYDANNRLTSVKDAGNNTIASYDYHSDGRLQQQTNGNGTVTRYFYDAAGRMDSIATINSSNTVIAAFGFSLDNNGSHTQERADIPNDLPLPSLTGMMLSGTYSYNRIQQYGPDSYSHDGNGNVLTGGAQFSYVWDVKDNLTSYTNGGVTTAFEYDPSEARRKRNNTRFVLDPLHDNNVLMETDGAGNPTAIYVHGLGLACRITPGSGARHFYHYDYRGSTVAITDNGQNVTHRYRYGAFGEDYGAQESGFTNSFRYVGKFGVMYEDSALYFMRARYYNPQLGRFLGEDPVWGSNLMVYCENNPVNYIDTKGTSIEILPNAVEVVKEVAPVVATGIPFSYSATAAYIQSIHAAALAESAIATAAAEASLSTAYATTTTATSVASTASTSAATAATTTATASIVAIGVVGAVAIAAEVWYLSQPDLVLRHLIAKFGEKTGRAIWSWYYGVALK